MTKEQDVATAQDHVASAEEELKSAEALQLAEQHTLAARAELEAAQAEPDTDTSWLTDPVFSHHEPYGENSDQFAPKRYHQHGHWFSSKGVYIKE